MLDYAGLERVSSGCIHFVHDHIENIPLLRDVIPELRRKGIACAYVRYAPGGGVGTIADEIGERLALDHRPYASGRRPWIRFLDDLIGLSFRVAGLVLIIDDADAFLAADRDEAFNLIEAFLIQFHHWFEKEKPCHLCFQLEPNPLIEQVFQK